MSKKKEKERTVLEEMLTKEFLSQCQTEQDVSKFLKKSHEQVAEKGDIRSLFRLFILVAYKYIVFI